jgi:uncharacterized protein HemX
MNTFYPSSRLTTNLITAALLTVFITGFGVFASVQVEKRASNCSLQQNRQHSKEYCNVEEVVASMKHRNPTTLCQCQHGNVLAYK